MSDTKGFWSSLPGVLTGLAAVITAVTGLYIAISNMPDGSGDNGEGGTGEGYSGDGDKGGGDGGGVIALKSSDLLDCTKFPTVNSVDTLMGWSNHFQDLLEKNPSSYVTENCNKVISYRGMAHCQDPNSIEIQYALKSSLELCEKQGFSWKDVTL